MLEESQEIAILLQQNRILSESNASLQDRVLTLTQRLKESAALVDSLNARIEDIERAELIAVENAFAVVLDVPQRYQPTRLCSGRISAEFQPNARYVIEVLPRGAISVDRAIRKIAEEINKQNCFNNLTMRRVCNEATVVSEQASIRYGKLIRESVYKQVMDLLPSALEELTGKKVSQ